MRPLQKTNKPNILVQNETAWRNELLAMLNAGEKPTEAMKARYRHSEIKDALVAETHGKCAYCESKIRHVTHGDIEHFIPKSKVPAKAYDWNNLTLACDKCNENKGDHYSADPARSHENILDPYADDPKEHLLFLREIVTPRPDSPKGLATEHVLKLRRGDLLERRRERMDFIDGIVRSYSLADPDYKKLILQDLFDNHLKDSDEFSASSNEYLQQLKSQGVIPQQP